MRNIKLPMSNIPFYLHVIFMINIHRPLPEFTSKERWEYFRDYYTPVHKTLVKTLLDNQNNYCAYCECSFNDRTPEIEHYVPKSSSTPEEDHTFDLTNLLLCCDGFRNEIKGFAADYNIQDSASLLSCGQRKADKDPRLCLNPYRMPSGDLFKLREMFSDILSEVTYELVRDDAACAALNVCPQRVDSSIELYGLNSLILLKNRNIAIHAYDAEVEQVLRYPPNLSILSQLKKYSADKDMPYYTVVHLYLEEVISICQSMGV